MHNSRCHRLVAVLQRPAKQKYRSSLVAANLIEAFLLPRSIQQPCGASYARPNGSRADVAHLYSCFSGIFYYAIWGLRWLQVVINLITTLAMLMANVILQEIISRKALLLKMGIFFVIITLQNTLSDNNLHFKRNGTYIWQAKPKIHSHDTNCSSKASRCYS